MWIPKQEDADCSVAVLQVVMAVVNVERCRQAVAVLQVVMAVVNVERCRQAVAFLQVAMAVVKVERYYQPVYLAEELVQSRGFVLD